jgi:hypothetical protein
MREEERNIPMQASTRIASSFMPEYSRSMKAVSHLASGLHSEVVLLVRSPLEDSALGVHLPALALTRADNNINSVCLMLLDRALLNLVAGHVLVGDDLGAVDGESLDLVGNNTVDSLTAESINGLLNQGSDLIVLLACNENDMVTISLGSHKLKKKGMQDRDLHPDTNVGCVGGLLSKLRKLKPRKRS